MKEYHEFLQLGYLTSSLNTQKNLNYKYNKEIKNYSFDDLLNVGYELLLTEVEKKLKENQNVVVPISGGLDSRLILSAITECKEASSIKTYTYGSPGALDYKIGQEIASKIGTNHTSINLKNLQYKYSDLNEYARNVDNPTIMFHNLPKRSLELEDNIIIASGYLGDVASGKRYQKSNESDENVREDYFKNMIKRHSFAVENHDLIEHLIEKIKFDDMINLTELEKIYILEHNAKLNYNQVIGYMGEINIYTPFFNTEFMNLLLSLPKKYREKQYFYKELIFKKAAKNLNDIPLTTYSGAKYNSNVSNKIYNRGKNAIKHRISKKILKFNSPYINYIDFRKKIILDNKFKNLLLDLLESLNTRNIDLYKDEIQKAIYEIQNNRISNPYNYLLLCSLEIYIRQGRISLNETTF